MTTQTQDALRKAASELVTLCPAGSLAQEKAKSLVAALAAEPEQQEPVATGIIEAHWSATPKTVKLTFKTGEQAEAFYDRVRQAFRAAPSQENKHG